MARADADLIRGSGLLKRPKRRQQSRVGRGSSGVDLESTDEWRLQRPNQVRHGSRIAPDRKSK